MQSTEADEHDAIVYEISRKPLCLYFPENGYLNDPFFLLFLLTTDLPTSTHQLLGMLRNISDMSLFDPLFVEYLVERFGRNMKGSLDMGKFCAMVEFLRWWYGFFDRREAHGCIPFDKFEAISERYQIPHGVAWSLFEAYGPKLVRRADRKSLERGLVFDRFITASMVCWKMHSQFHVRRTDQNGCAIWDM